MKTREDLIWRHTVLNRRGSPFRRRNSVRTVTFTAATIAVFSLLNVSCKVLTSQFVPANSTCSVQGAPYCLPVGKVTVKVTKIAGRGAPLAISKPPLPDGAEIPTPNNTEAPLSYTPPKYRIQYVSTVYVPDPRRKFALDYHGSGISHDIINVKIGKNSLIKEVDVSVEDRSLEIAKILIETGTNIVRIGAQAGGDNEPEELFTATFDPTNYDELLTVNELLSRVEGGPYSVNLLQKSSSQYSAKDSNYEMPADFGCDPELLREQRDGVLGLPGVVFRPGLAYNLVLERENQPMEMASITLPNEAEILFLPVTRASFVKKVQKLEFEDGMLTAVTIDKPSEVEGAVKIPLEISRAVLALPGQIIADNIAALEGEKNQIAKTVEVVQAQKTLEDARVDSQIASRTKETELIRSEIDLREAKEELRNTRSRGDDDPNDVVQ